MDPLPPPQRRALRHGFVVAALGLTLVLVGETALRGGVATAARTMLGIPERAPALHPAFSNSLVYDKDYPAFYCRKDYAGQGVGAQMCQGWDGVVQSNFSGSRVRGVFGGGDGAMTSEGMVIRPGDLGGYVLIAGLYREINPTRGQWSLEATVRPNYTHTNYSKSTTRLEVYERHQVYWMNLRTDIEPVGTVRCGFTWSNGTIVRLDAPLAPVREGVWTKLRCSLRGGGLDPTQTGGRVLKIEVNDREVARRTIGNGTVVVNPQTPVCIGCKYRVKCKDVCTTSTEGLFKGAIRDVLIQT